MIQVYEAAAVAAYTFVPATKFECSPPNDFEWLYTPVEEHHFFPVN
jgi:hypothetical protein